MAKTNNEQPNTPQSWLDVTQEALNKATAEANADAVSAALPQPEEDQRQANINAVRSRGQQQAAAQANSIAMQPVDTGMPAGNQDQLSGQLWSGQAGYANGTAPRIVRLGDGSMMAEVGGVFSYVKDEKEAAFIIGVDREQADVQLKRQKYRIQEAQLEAALDAMTASTTTFNTFNRKLLTDMVGELADYPPEVADKLRGLYEDEGLMDGLYKLPPNEFVQSVTQLKEMVLGGSSPRDISSYANKSRTRGSRVNHGYYAEVDAGFEGLLQEYSSDMDEAERRVQELEDQKRKYLAEGDEMTDPGELAASANALFGDAIRSAQKNLEDARSNYQRIITKRDSIRSQIGSEFDPSSYGGSSSIDSVYNSKAYRGRISKYGGTIWSIMDLVARDSGFGDGLNTPGFKAQLADPEQAAMFIAECQRKAVLNGWSTESVEPWVNGLAQHVLGSPDAGEIANLVNAAMNMVNADFQRPEQQREAGGAGVDGLSLIQSPEFLTTLTPASQSVLKSGVRPSEGTPEFDELKFDILTSSSNLPQEQQDALLSAFMSIPETSAGAGGASDRVVTAEDKQVLSEGYPGYDEDMFYGIDLPQRGRGGPQESRYRDALSKVLSDRLPQSVFEFAMNSDGVFDRDRSDAAWEQVKAEAAKLSSEDTSVSKEDVDLALKDLESMRHGSTNRNLPDILGIRPESYQ